MKRKLCLEQIEVKIQEIVDKYFPEWPYFAETLFDDNGESEIEKEIIAELEYANDEEFFNLVQSHIDVLEDYIQE